MTRMSDVELGAGYAASSTKFELRESERPAIETAVNQLDPPEIEEEGWKEWLRHTFPRYVGHDFAGHQIEFWEWVEDLETGLRPRPFVAIWPRGGAKSTSIELAVVRVGAKQTRSYVWYVCETQEQADKHVETIAEMLESPTLESRHPMLAQRKLSKYGHSRGWRRNRLRTSSGLTVDAMGLDKASRGAKVEHQRPDLIVFDDIDGKHDRKDVQTAKKKRTITETLLPAGSSDAAVVVMQNLVIQHGIVAQLAGVADEDADFLMDRYVSGPHPAIRDLDVEEELQEDGRTRYVIVEGEPIWEGQGKDKCQEQIDTWGYSAFMREAQHDVKQVSGGIWDHITWRRCEPDEVPDLVQGCLWVDPAVSSTDNSDCQGIQADGLSADGTLYRLFSWEQQSTPEEALKLAFRKALSLGLTVVGIETDQGGDTWHSVATQSWRKLVRETLRPQAREQAREQMGQEWEELSRSEKEEEIKLRIPRRPKLVFEKAGSGHGSKVHRNQKMLHDYETGRVIHVRGTHRKLEKALIRFGAEEPYDLADAAYWSWRHLRPGSKGVYL